VYAAKYREGGNSDNFVRSAMVQGGGNNYGTLRTNTVNGHTHSIGNGGGTGAAHPNIPPHVSVVFLMRIY
jgi:hypothetical protein